MIEFIDFQPDIHHPILADWWTGHKWPVIPISSLPKNGLICTYNKKPVCSGFIYKTEVDIAWMEWVLCDPQADREYRGSCIDALIEKLSELAKNMGYRLIFTSVANTSLIKRLEKYNFGICDTNVTNLVRVL